LEIGFGVGDVVRVMAKSEGGATMLGLGSALRECYADDISVEVLLEYARTTKVESVWMPSNIEWRALLDACAGVLSGSMFPRHAETMMQLLDKTSRLGAFGADYATPETRRGCSTPKKLAEALEALAKVSHSKLQSVTFAGGPDIGWLAAVADWLLDLRVIMVEESTGELLYRNYDDTETYQVRLYRARTGSETDPAPSVNVPESSTTAQNEIQPKKRLKLSLQPVQIREKVQYVKLEDITQVLLDEERKGNQHVVSGRVEWKHALRSAFLSDFERLMEQSATFGALLGSIARILQALVGTESTIRKDYRLRCTNYSDKSHGPGFVNNIIDWFPELAPLRKVMAENLRCSFVNAKRTYESCISTLRAHCNCVTCQNDPTRFSMIHDKFNSDDSRSEHDISTTGTTNRSGGSIEWDPNSYCEVVIVETIVYLCRLLSNVHLVCEAVLPVRSGFEIAYGRQLELRKFYDQDEDAFTDFGPALYCIENEKSFAEKYNNSNGIEHRLSAVLELFTGRRGSAGPWYGHATSALWTHGITAFLGVLRDENCEDRNDTSKIYVNPGRIHFESKSYTRLTDAILPQDECESRCGSGDFDKPREVLQSSESFSERGLNITEGPAELRCLLEFPQDRLSSASKHISVGPSDLAFTLACRRGLVPCKYKSRKACSKSSETKRWPSTAVSERLIEVRMGEKTVYFLSVSSSSHALATVASTLYYPLALVPFLIDRECRDCCLKFALSYENRHECKLCFVRTMVL
jgi:hypothetical protein